MLDVSSFISGRCFKTGARVYLPEWNATVRADMYYVAPSAIVVRYNPKSFSYNWKEEDNGPIHYEVSVGNDSVHNQYEGLIVCSVDNVAKREVQNA